MNSLELREMNADHVVYAYSPNGEGVPGEVEYLFADGKTSVLRQSSDDFNGYYAHKACNKVTECVRKNNLPIKFVQAWY
ncbi:MAG: hypothetical protein LBG83_02165 [Oscillospiraceae bacterium]|jgi:hypothetical protein|nr:hypothetical protein [Oscillospiraceae bacterium]